MSAIDKGTQNPLRWDFSKSQILESIYLAIRGTIAGTISAPNALGKACIIREVRGFVNTSGEIFRFSGAQYHYLLRDHCEDFKDPVPGSDARSAVAAGAYNLDMMIPLAVSAIDERGLILLQHDRTVFTLTVEFEVDATIATGITTHTCTVTPYQVLYSVPPGGKENRPSFNTIQQLLGHTVAVPAGADFEYPWPAGNAYLGLYFGLGIGVAGADGWSRAFTRVSQTDAMYTYDPKSMDLEFSRFHGRARLPGQLLFDFLGSDGLGAYGGDRDLIFSNLVSDLKTVITPTGAGTLHVMRRQLMAIAEQEG